ncbi:hypothetical protein [Streptomyces sp. NPDC057939]|uniref:hypothetical protein n=1 Tax=Streptomyces sp. NPDC057939 TaxID=3346284 RepID=UPI0036EB9EDA
MSSSDGIDVTGVYAAAHNVQPYLKRLLGPKAEAFRTELDTVLAETDPPDEAGAARLTELLGRHRATRTHLEDVLSDRPLYRPARKRGRDTLRGGPVGLPGPVPPVSIWKCGACGHTWPRADAADPVPEKCEHCRTPGVVRMPSI